MRLTGVIVSWPLRAAIMLYRLTISPFLPNSCRYAPTCSAYALEAIEQHGPFGGLWLTFRRMARCHPWGGDGYDPVPPPGHHAEAATAASEPSR